MNEREEIQIPFSGFYGTWHEDIIDRRTADPFRDTETGDDGEIPDKLYIYLNVSEWFDLYVQEYGDRFVAGLNEAVGREVLKRGDITMTSPREYNFETDRLFKKITQEEILALREVVDLEKLKEVCTDKHTSCSGFISFYDPDFTTWGNVIDWDHNQLCSLLEAVCQTHWPEYEETLVNEMMEAIECCGGVLDDTPIIAAVDKAIEAEDDEKELEKLKELRTRIWG